MSENLKKLNYYIRENETLGVVIQGYLEELFRENSIRLMQADDGELTTRMKGRLTMLAELAEQLTGIDNPNTTPQIDITYGE